MQITLPSIKTIAALAIAACIAIATARATDSMSVATVQAATAHTTMADAIVE